MGRERRTSLLLCASTLLLLAATVNARLAVMSIDLGSEFMKIAIVKPGVPMEIVLNKESSRKTPTLVAFRDGERQFGNQAQSTSVKFPAKAYSYLPLIVGKQFDDPYVELFRQRFPHYTMEQDPDRGTVLFRTEDDSLYSVEELLAMILDKAREYAQDFAQQDIKDCVITVPAFFTQAERRAVLASAKMVGINVLQLMGDNSAVALNYGVFRRNNFNSTSQFYMFYDMGATSTTATIVGYNVAKTKEGTRVESNPQLTVKGVGFDRTLGGLEVTLRLRQHLASMFNSQKKTSQQVEENPRAMAKLLKEAERVKKVLSANADHTAQVEGLLDEKDFRGPVTRAELEQMSEDLFDRITKPIEDALKASEITLPEITEVILMGGATRMPKVQEVLVKYLGRSDLGKSINTDEAAAMGAVYQAAYLGKGFKVKKFGVREANIYPINVEFEKQKTEEEASDPGRTIRRTLFGRMNPFPQRKVMTFNKHTKDFGFNVSYTGLDFLSEDDRKSLGTRVSRYSLSGVEAALEKNKGAAESKGIKAHFQMDNSGILTLDKVESLFEKNDTDADKEKSTWSKLGSAIGGLFGSGGAEDNKVEDSPDEPTVEEEQPEEMAADGEKKEEEKTGADADKKTEEKKEKKETEKEKSKEEDTKEEKKEEEKADKKSESTEKGSDKEKEKTGEDNDKKPSEPAAPKIVNVKEVIKSESQIADVPDMSEDRFKQASKRLAELRKQDEEKMELEKAQNELESFIFSWQDKLSQETFEKCSTEGEREKLSKALSDASDWLYEIEGAKKTDFTSKLKSLQELTKPITRRVTELEERPKAMETLRSALNQTTVFLATVKNLSSMGEAASEEAIFTPVEVETLEKLIVDTRSWRDKTVKEQEALKDSEDPVLLVADIGAKIAALDREMRYLINKAKNFKPKPKPEPKKEDANDTKTSEGDKSGEGETNQSTEEQEAPHSDEQVPPPPQEESESSQEGGAQEEAPAKEEAKEGEEDVERTSSGKRRPKQKRKAFKEAQQKEEELLELDTAESEDAGDSKTDTEEAQHTEL